MKPALRILIFVLAMGTFAGGLLVGVNYLTAPRILKNEELKLKSSVLGVLEIEHTKQNVINTFKEKVRVLEKEKRTFYIGPDESIAFEFHGPGLWGPIAGIISLEKGLKTIRKIWILHQEETPGLGGRVAEIDYLSRFKGKEFVPMLVFVPEGKADEANEVDAITGATGTSRAFEKLINQNVQEAIRILCQKNG